MKTGDLVYVFLRGAKHIGVIIDVYEFQEHVRVLFSDSLGVSDFHTDHLVLLSDF